MSFWRNYIMVAVIIVNFCSTSWGGALNHHWSQGFGDVSFDNGEGVAIDGLGNVLVTGEFRGTVDFGGGPLTSSGQGDIFIAKFNVAGDHVWSNRFGGICSERCMGTAVDDSGNVFATGYFQCTVDFGGGPLTNPGGFLAKFDAAGNHLWSQEFGGGEGRCVAVDGSGNVIVTGYFMGSVDFGGGTLTSAGSYDIFVAKFDADGNHLWSKSFGDASDQKAEGVAVDGSGNVVVVGSFQGTLDFGGFGWTITSAGGYDVFMVKFDADGDNVWLRPCGDANRQGARSVAVDGSGNVFATGYFEGSVSFGCATLTSAGGTDIFVAKYNADGSCLWSQRFGNTSDQYGNCAAADSAGNVVLTGWFWGNVDFGGDALYCVGEHDIYVAKFDANGGHVWSQSFGDLDYDYGIAADIDESENVVVTGLFNSSVDFGGGILTSAGISDIFLVRFDAVGPICSVQPPSIDVGKVAPLAYRDTVFTVKNFGHSGTIDGDVSEPCGSYSVLSGGGPFSLAAGESLLVTVRFEPTALGTHNCTIETGDDLCSDVDLTGVAMYCVNVPLGVVSWWPLDESSGTTAEDLISGYNGAHHNDPTPIVGLIDGALQFDGTDDYVDVPDNDALNITTDVTVELWFRLDGTGTYQLVSKGGGWSSYTEDLASSYFIEAAGSSIRAGFEASGGANFVISGPLPADGQWHFVAYRRMGNNNQLYLDGTLVADGTASISPGSTVGYDLNIGRMWDAYVPARYLDGAIDELTIYNRALDPSEIEANYAAGAVGKCKDVLPSPQIEDIADVPDDQGGWARIHFVRSMLDHADEDSLPVTDYGIHRRVDDPALIAQLVENGDRDPIGEFAFSASANEPQSVSTSKCADVLMQLGDRYYRVVDGADAAAPPGVWEVLGTVPARQQDNYIYLAPTLADSAETIPYSVFFISAHTTTPSIYFDSPPDSGYSVDNIAPGVPQSFAVAYNTGSGNQLTWDPAPEPDFQYYRIFRGGNENFTPDLANLVHETATPTWIDPDYNDGSVHYKVTAVDDAGNESDPAAPGNVTAVAEPAIPKTFALHQNVPNPFNPATTIHYDVPAAGGKVTLQVYDVAGRLVSTLVDGVQAPGEKQVMWDGRNSRGNAVATGVYFYKLTAPGFEQTRKMVMMK